MLAVAPVSPNDQPTAERLAQELQTVVLEPATDPRSVEQYFAVLMVSGHRIALQQCGRNMPGEVSVDFGSGGMRHRRRGGNNEDLGKAVGVKKRKELFVLDATAGLGRDSFVLADMGCKVRLCEREPLVALLLQAGLDAARSSDDEWLRAVSSRMHLVSGDATELPSSLIDGIDVIYLDPMFPQRRQSAAVKKEMAILQRLLPDSQEGAQPETLLRWALEQPVARIVLKRPRKAPLLDDTKPSHSLQGKSIRFDVFVKRALQPRLTDV
ncbi:MAG: class I SAM-dependent methyltransferase [Halioglobus sp.]